MDTLPDLERNSPASFWKLGSPVAPAEWEQASREAKDCLAGLPVGQQDLPANRLQEAILSESQFGPSRRSLSPAKRIYYSLLRPLFTPAMRLWLHRWHGRHPRPAAALGWPIEDRYVRYQFKMVSRILAQKQQGAMDFCHFWPQGKRFALVLTHDVETAQGQQFVKQLAALEERYGFRSSFNFVPEGYAVDLDLMAELKERGFEIGVHGLKHDGQLFASKALFDARAQKINAYLQQWGAVGFRSPMTHRHPLWMQTLDIEYDLSFFDTDPYEPMAGGSMSIWPFFLGHFVELPYTLAQDHTLLVTLGETTPRLWLDKVAFIRTYYGMALINTHPDYLRRPEYFGVYEDFLRHMRASGDYWPALPGEVARWWRRRNGMLFPTEPGRRGNRPVPDATIGRVNGIPGTDGIGITPIPSL